jgi:hypothetical protein
MCTYNLYEPFLSNDHLLQHFKRLQNSILQPFLIDHFPFLLFPFLSSPPDTVDVPLEVALVDEFRQHQLVEDRYRAGIESHLSFIGTCQSGGKTILPIILDTLYQRVGS